MPSDRVDKKSCTHILNKVPIRYNGFNDVLGMLREVTEETSVVEKIPCERVFNIELKLRIDNYVKRIWKQPHLVELVRGFSEQIKKVLDVTDEQLGCVVLSIPSCYKDEEGSWMDRLSFFFPYFRIPEWIKNEQLTSYIEHFLNDSDVFKKLTKDSPSSALGTRGKDIHSDGNYHLLPIGIENRTWDVEIYCTHGEVVSLKNFLPKDSPKYTKDIWKGLLTSYHGIRVSQGIVDFALVAEKNINVQKSKHRTANGKRRKNLPIPSYKATENLAIADNIIKMLKVGRITNKNWRSLVGQILFDIGEGSETALVIWDTFLNPWKEYTSDYADDEWCHFTGKNHTINSLKVLAQTDSPEEYKEWLDSRIVMMMRANVRGTDHEIASVIYEAYGPYFITSSLRKSQDNCWYHYERNHWKLSQSGYKMLMYISNEVYLLYARLQQDFYEQLTLCHDDKNKRKDLLEAINSVMKIMDKLKDVSPMDKILRACQLLFYREDFDEMRDNNPEMIAFPNGVLDMSTDEEFFRMGLPDDNITKCMNISFDKNLNSSSKEVKMWKKFLKEVLYEKELMRYLQEKGARLLVGFNEEKEVDMWTGRYNNAKSTLLMLLKYAFGKYMVMIPFNIFTKGQQNGLCPELQRAGAGVRIVAAEEGNGEEEKFNAGIVKQMSGNTEYFARALFQDGHDIKPMFKIVMTINEDMPRAPPGDEAFWGRFRLVPFETQFVKTERGLPDTYEERLKMRKLPIDQKFRSKMPEIARGMLWSFVSEYRYARHQGAVELPKSILAATKGYRSNNDSISQFLEEKTCVTEGGKLLANDMFTIFGEWYTQAYGKKIDGNMNRNKMIKYLCNSWGKPSNGVNGMFWEDRGWLGGEVESEEVADQESYG